MKPPAVVFGVPIDNLTMSSTIESIAELVDDGRRHGRSHQIATVNVDFLVNALSDPTLTELLQNTASNLPDGMPILWAASLLGTPLTERVAGADLVPELGRESAARGWRVHLFGGAPGVADRARSELIARYPGAHITSDSGPALRDVTEVDEHVIDSIRAHDPDVLCVALGNPKQERFIAAHRDRVGCPVMIGIGGSLDMLVGDKRRAPSWAQRSGVEWVYRALQEPGRLGRRYLHDGRVFGPHLVRYATDVRRHQVGSILRAHLEYDVVHVRPDQRAHDIDQWRAVYEHGFSAVHVDFDGVPAVTGPSHAALIGLLRLARRRRARCTMVGWTPALRTCVSDFGSLSWLDAVARANR